MKNFVNRPVLYAMIGILYSVLFPLIGGWMPYYVMSISVFHSLLIAIAFGLSYVIFFSISDREEIYSLGLGLFVSLHFGYWFVNFSMFSTSPVFPRVVTTISIGVCIIAIIYWLQHLNLDSWKWSFALFLFSVLVIGSKAYIVSKLPLRIVGNKTLLRYQEDHTSVQNYLYPFSSSLSHSISQFPYLFPELDVDKGVFILTLDALRDNFVGRKIAGQSITPSIDKIEEDGQRFSRYYVQSNWTGASTASLFTGKYPHEHGVCTLFKKRGQRLPGKYQTLAEGYNSSKFFTLGSSFVPHLTESMQFDQGYDRWISLENHFRDDIIAIQKLLLSIIREQPRKIFLYTHMQGPHGPYKKGLQNQTFWNRTSYLKNGQLHLPRWKLPSPDALTRSKFDDWLDDNSRETITGEQVRFLRYLYASQVNFYDRFHLRQFVKALKGLGLYKESLVILTADHGEELLDVGFSGSSVSPLRRYGHTENLRENVTSPPLIIKLPDNRNSRTVSSKRNFIVESVDLTATLFDFINFTTVSTSGDSFLGELKGTSPSIEGARRVERNPFSQALTELCRFKKGTYDRRKDVITFSRKELQENLKISRVAFVKDQWKLVKDYFRQENYLIDLRKRYFRRNSIENRPDVKNKLMEHLQSILPDTGIQNKPGRFRVRTPDQIRTLKGLGYF